MIWPFLNFLTIDLLLPDTYIFKDSRVCAFHSRGVKHNYAMQYKNLPQHPLRLRAINKLDSPNTYHAVAMVGLVRLSPSPQLIHTMQSNPLDRYSLRSIDALTPTNSSMPSDASVRRASFYQIGIQQATDQTESATRKTVSLASHRRGTAPVTATSGRTRCWISPHRSPGQDIA